MAVNYPEKSPIDWGTVLADISSFLEELGEGVFARTPLIYTSF